MFVFEWDEKKEKVNLRKHKISFAEARTVFDDAHSIKEERLISIGFSKLNRLLLVVHTEVSTEADEILIRIISSRKATALEREIYEIQ